MARSLEQDTRVGSFSTPMGKDKLVLAGFQAEEGLSELFEIRVEALSETADIDFDTTLGTGCVVSVQTHNRKQRHFHGIMVEAQSAGMAQDLHAYRIVLRPWLWLLSRVADCRIFHEKTALEIIKKVFDAHDFASGKYQLRTSKDYPKLEYCVQYRETDLAFVCRLMEQHGIYYYFEHSEGDHTMILADAKSSHKPVPGLATVNFIPDETGDQVREENIKHWSAGRHFRAGKVQLRDYNYMTPDANMTSDSDKSGKYSHGSLQLYDYPGKYKDKSEGEAYAKVRNEAEQAHDRRRFGDGDAVSLFPGGLTTLARHDTASENREYLLVRAFHELELQGYRSGNGGGGRTYTGRYEFLPSDRPFRAPALTPRPMVHGPQTALVVTEQKGGSEEIEVDKEGRIMVQFYWDRDDAKSCWVRVGQVWAGPSWGGQLIPRVGMEVIVVFLEGDPDRPLVVGTVYNGKNKYPYPMPGDKTISGLKSDSSKGHGGYNEFVFDDKKSAEKIRMHAQKTHEVVVLDNETKEFGKEGKHTHTRETTLVTGNDKLDVQAGKQIVTIKIDRDVTIDNNDKLEITGNQTEKVTGNHELTVMGTIKITSMQKITLTCGASTITLSPTGIDIVSGTISLSAPQISLN